MIKHLNLIAFSVLAAVFVGCSSSSDLSTEWMNIDASSVPFQAKPYLISQTEHARLIQKYGAIDWSQFQPLPGSENAIKPGRSWKVVHVEPLDYRYRKHLRTNQVEKSILFYLEAREESDGSTVRGYYLTSQLSNLAHSSSNARGTEPQR